MNKASILLAFMLLLSSINLNVVGDRPRCEIDISVSQGLPRAVSYGNRVTVAYTYSKEVVGQVTRCEVSSATVSVSGSLSLSSVNVNGGSVSANLLASSLGTGSARAVVKYSYCFYDEEMKEEICTETLTATESLGSTYSVGVPRFNVYLSPSKVRRGKQFTLTVTGLDEVDDGYGTLSVRAKVFGSYYTIPRTRKGTFSHKITVPNVRKGVYEVSVKVTKEYGGISDTKYSRRSLRVLGDPPTVRLSGGSFRKGSQIPVIVEEVDGDEVTGFIRAFNNTIEVSGTGSYQVEVPHVKAGEYSLEAFVRDSDGNFSKSFKVTVLGSPPRVEGDVPPKVHRGDLITVSISEEDGDDVRGELSFGPLKLSLSEGNQEIAVPRDILASNYTLEVSAGDVDGWTNVSWPVTVENLEPEVNVSLSASEASPGDVVTVTVTASDDAEGLQVELIVKETGERFQLSPDGGVVNYEVPRQSSSVNGALTFAAKAQDIDGVVATDVASLIVKLPDDGQEDDSANQTNPGNSNESADQTSPEGQPHTNRTSDWAQVNRTETQPGGEGQEEVNESKEGREPSETRSNVTAEDVDVEITLRGDREVNSTLQVIVTVSGGEEAYVYVRGPDLEVKGSKRVRGSGLLEVLLDELGTWSVVGVVPNRLIKTLKFSVIPPTRTVTEKPEGLQKEELLVNSSVASVDKVIPREMEVREWGFGGCIIPRRASRVPPQLTAGLLLATFILAVWRWKH